VINYCLASYNSVLRQITLRICVLWSWKKPYLITKKIKLQCSVRSLMPPKRMTGCIIASYFDCYQSGNFLHTFCMCLLIYTRRAVYVSLGVPSHLIIFRLFMGSSRVQYWVPFYVDDLLLLLKKACFGCYISAHFVGALIYADDIVAPPAAVLRKMLAICEDYEYCICFNAAKSKCLVILPICRRSLAKEFQSYIFYVANKPIEHVKSLLYLSHSFTSEFNDDEDIINGRSKFVHHTNNSLCYFRNCILLFNINCFRLTVLAYMTVNFGY